MSKVAYTLIASAVTLLAGSLVLADALYLRGQATGDIGLVRLAARVNPAAAEYRLADYRLGGDIAAVRRAVAIEPTKPAYHMFYGLALLKQKNRTRESDAEAVSEVCKAATLKPYSKQYRDICAAYRAAIVEKKGGGR